MTLLSVQRLVKRFDSAAAVNDLSFSVEEGRCVALLGPNGAGKTTTLKLLAGLLAPSEGEIRFTPNENERLADIRRHIGFLPQHPSFFSWMSGSEYLIFSGRLARLSKQEAKLRAGELLEELGLAKSGNRRIGGYSGGMKQRLGIAQALIHRPQLLLLDEPVSALDPFGRREVLEMIRHIRKETTVLFSTHVLHDAEAICDDILIMNQGQIAAAGTIAEVRRQYSEPVIRIQAEVPLDEWAARWRSSAFVQEIELKEFEAALTVTDLETARARLWRDLGEREIPVVRFEAGLSTLEDWFMKAVKA